MIWFVVACVICYGAGFVTAFWAMGALMKKAFSGFGSFKTPPTPPEHEGNSWRKQQ